MQTDLSIVVQIISAIVSAVTAIGVAVVAVMTKVYAARIEELKVRAELDKHEIKNTVEVAVQKSDARAGVTAATLAVAEKTQGEILHQGNSMAGAQMKLTALALGRVAQLTKDPADIAAATEADRLHASHLGAHPK